MCERRSTPSHLPAFTSSGCLQTLEVIRVAEVALEASALENLRGVAKSIASTAEGMRLRELDVSYSGDSVVEAVTAFVMLCPKLRVLSMRLLGITDSMFQDMGMSLVGWQVWLAH